MNPSNDVAKREPQSLRASGRFPTVSPPVDVYENTDEILLVADMPGVSSESLNVNLENGELLVEATRELVPGGALVESEYGPCTFQRRFVLPSGIDVGRVSADLRDGVLKLHLPKAAAAKPRKIEVRAG